MSSATWFAALGLVLTAIGVIAIMREEKRRRSFRRSDDADLEGTWGAEPTFEPDLTSTANSNAWKISPPEVAPADSPSRAPKATWLVPAVLVFGGAILTTGGTVVQAWLDDPDVDCVAYVEALTELAGAYDELDADSLAAAFGQMVREQCGAPEAFMTAIGRGTPTAAGASIAPTLPAPVVSSTSEPSTAATAFGSRSRPTGPATAEGSGPPPTT